MPAAFCQCGKRSFIGALYLMQRIHQSLQGFPSHTQGTPPVAMAVGVRVGVSGCGSRCATDASDGDTMSNAITLSSSDPEAAAPSPTRRNKFHRTALRVGHSLSQLPVATVVKC